MVTILLADDERIFKAVQGTLLRREACRLLKASFGSLLSLAVRHSPDLVIVPAVRDMEVDRLVEEMRGRPGTRSIPIIILETDRDQSTRRPETPDGAPIEVVRVGAYPDPGRIQTELAPVFERLLDLKGREADRVPAEVAVRCTLGTNRFTARTKDISLSGLFLKTEQGVHAGDRVAVSFKLPSSGEDAAGSIDGECEVVRLIARDRDDPDLIPGAGLRFVRLPRHARELLERFVPPATRRYSRAKHASPLHTPNH